jgi:hypothetical protein
MANKRTQQEGAESSLHPRAILCVLQFLPNAQNYEMYSCHGGRHHKVGLDVERFTRGGNRYISHKKQFPAFKQNVLIGAQRTYEI